MNAAASIESFPTPGSIRRANQLRNELRAFTLLLLLCNVPLLLGRSTDAFAFLPRAVAAGEWWRVLTHPFAHVSWYHLLLDGSAFLILYQMLGSKDRWSRLGAVVACALGSVGIAWLACPLVADIGLCGLSGIAHGLLAITAVEMIASAGTNDRVYGLLCLTVVVAKSCLEALTGCAVLATLHFGMLGTPIAICHAGGVLGGLFFVAISYPPTSARASAARAVER